MAISKTNNGDGTTTIAFSYTATHAKIQTHGDLWAEFEYDRLSPADIINKGLPATFAELTNAQRGQLLDDAVFALAHSHGRNVIAQQEDATKQSSVNSRAADELFDQA